MTSVSTVHRSSFTFHSDIGPSQREAHQSGILHATKVTAERGHRREEHAFAWLADRGHAANVVAHLDRFGFAADRAVFLPYSSQEQWIACYPHAWPYVGCDSEGEITGVTEGAIASCLPDGAVVPPSEGARPKKRRKAAAPKLLPAANLSDAERAHLHLEIYHYFTWLHARLTDMEEKEGGHKIMRWGISMPSVPTLLAKFEGTFKNVKEFKRKKDGEGGVAALPLPLVPALPPVAGQEGADHAGDVTGGDTAIGEGEREASPATRWPLLETSMAGDLRLVLEEARHARGGDTPAPAGPAASFDALLGHLAAFRREHGHARVPCNHIGGTSPGLGKWVSHLRARRKKLRARGQAAEPPAAPRPSDFPVPRGRLGLALRFDGAGPGGVVVAVEPACTFGDRVAAGDRLMTVDGAAVLKAEDLAAGREKEMRILGFVRPRPPSESVYHLSAERVERLDALDFVWEIPRSVKSWDERFELLKQYKATHGKWPTHKETWEGIGTWLHGQRKKHREKNPQFIAQYQHRLEEIGVPLRDEKRLPCLKWEDHFQRLVEFGRVNRHFDVPCPEENSEEEARASVELRFFRWVQSIHAAYPAFREGRNFRHSILNEDRVNQLLELGFEFQRTFGGKTFKEKTSALTARMKAQISDIPFEKRLLQLSHFREEFGHLAIDHRYSKMDNIGGWAVDISKRYAEWQEGKGAPAPVDDYQLGQLRALGFKFDVVAVRRSKRSWQESFEAFLEFKTLYGHSNVPFNCKVDARLGVWAKVQRDQYTLLNEGKTSRLTPVKVERLQKAGFLWEYEKAVRHTSSTE